MTNKISPRRCHVFKIAYFIKENLYHRPLITVKTYLMFVTRIKKLGAIVLQLQFHIVDGFLGALLHQLQAPALLAQLLHLLPGLLQRFIGQLQLVLELLVIAGGICTLVSTQFLGQPLVLLQDSVNVGSYVGLLLPEVAQILVGVRRQSLHCPGHILDAAAVEGVAFR